MKIFLSTKHKIERSWGPKHLNSLGRNCDPHLSLFLRKFIDQRLKTVVGWMTTDSVIRIQFEQVLFENRVWRQKETPHGLQTLQCVQAYSPNNSNVLHTSLSFCDHLWLLLNITWLDVHLCCCRSSRKWMFLFVVVGEKLIKSLICFSHFPKCAVH